MPTRTADVAALYDAERDGTVVLRLHVQPGAARSEVVGPHGEALRSASSSTTTTAPG